MFVLFGLMAQLLSAAPSGGMDVPNPTWESPTSATTSLSMGGADASAGEQRYGYGGRYGGDYGYRRRRLSGPGLIVGGAVMTGIGAALLATQPRQGWNDVGAPEPTNNAAGVILVVGGVVMMGCGIAITMADQ
ncbi:MAG TPA: hypothetical protein VN931_10380 [Fibrobacteria bacterium]|nr:hypothetical protein [Fibrobacteria bacterium]